jgi:adenylate kinase
MLTNPHNAMPLPLNIVLLGFPGSGKSTQAKLLSERLGMAHVDMGGCLRRAAGEDSETGRLINDVIHHRKELVSDEVVREVLDREIGRIPSDRGVVLDGAPRRASQIDEIEGSFRRFGRRLGKVVFLVLTEEESVRRIAGRYACSSCRRSLVLGKDVGDASGGCPVCGAKLEQRPDDTPEGVRQRLRVFARETAPVIGHYRSAGMLVEVDADAGIEGMYGAVVAGIRDSGNFPSGQGDYN